MRRSTLLSSLLLLLCACAAEDRSELRRRPVRPAAQSGWGRLSLDGEAQRSEGLWLGDAAGRSVPFLREREGLWAPQELATTGLLLGRDDKDQPSVELGLKLPDGWQVREREQLRVDLDLEGEAPWVARVEIARRIGDGGYLTLEEPAPRFVYDLGSSQRLSQMTLPWDGERYRLILVPTQGKAPRIRGVRITASTWPEALAADETVEPASFGFEDKSGEWRVDLPREERIVALDVMAEAPCAPVGVFVDAIPHVSVHERSQDSPGLSSIGGSGLIWNLPAFHSVATRVTVSPTITSSLRLRVPSGVRLLSAKVLVRRETLLFPAEAGQTYYLHSGGADREAPGNLGALPASRTVYSREPLRLSASEPDPQGAPRIIPGSERTRPWLPWAVGLVVLALGAAAWRLLKAAPPAS
jgi:hypothetical protein